MSWRKDLIRALVLAALLGVGLALLGAGKIPKYNRAEWHPRWIDADKDCQDTRQEVLIRESRQSALEMSPDGCTVVKGLWLDPYGREVLTDPDLVDIDHVVPLEFMHRHGGHLWTTSRKNLFANDLSYRFALLAVRDRLNQGKGSKGPAEWLPPRPEFQCRYGEIFATILVINGAWIDAQTRAAIRALVSTC